MGAEHHFGEYAKMYAKLVKGITVIGLFNTWFCNGFPSLKDVVMGLYSRYCEMIAESLKERPAQVKQQAQDDAKQIFEYILECSGVEDVDRPITYEELWDPKSSVVCLLLYLYSIEPPFYADVNKAIRLRDKAMLRTLGPFVRCLYQILVGGGTESVRSDRLLHGRDDLTLPGNMGFFSQSFLLYRGAAMKESWIKAWKQQIGRKLFEKSDEALNVSVNSIVNSTRSLYQAFRQIELSKEFKIPVLFVISAVNFDGFCGFRLNSEDYSAYPQEREYLLMDGIRFIVMKIEEFPVERIAMLNRRPLDTPSTASPKGGSSERNNSSSLSSGLGGGLNVSLATVATHSDKLTIIHLYHY